MTGKGVTIFWRVIFVLAAIVSLINFVAFCMGYEMSKWDVGFALFMTFMYFATCSITVEIKDTK